MHADVPGFELTTIETVVTTSKHISMRPTAVKGKDYRIWRVIFEKNRFSVYQMMSDGSKIKLHISFIYKYLTKCETVQH